MNSIADDTDVLHRIMLNVEKEGREYDMKLSVGIDKKQ